MGKVLAFAAAGAASAVALYIGACAEFGSTSAEGAAPAEAGASDAQVTDGGGDATSGDAASPRSIRCNGEICTGADVCCVALDGGSFASAACVPSAACATTLLACDSKSECWEGQYCCAQTNGGSAVWASASCQATPCVYPDEQLCDDAAECAGKACSAAPAYVGPAQLRACE